MGKEFTAGAGEVKGVQEGLSGITPGVESLMAGARKKGPKAQERRTVSNRKKAVEKRMEILRETDMTFATEMETGARKSVYYAKDPAQQPLVNLLNEAALPTRQLLDQIAGELTAVHGVLPVESLMKRIGRYSHDIYPDALRAARAAGNEATIIADMQKRLQGRATEAEAAQIYKDITKEQGLGASIGIKRSEVGWQKHGALKDLPLDDQLRYGKLLDAQVSTAKYLANVRTWQSKQQLFTELAERFKGYKGEMGPGYKMPNSPEIWGDLAGQTMPRGLMPYLKAFDRNQLSEFTEHAAAWATRTWKKWHTAYSTSTAIRNGWTAFAVQSEIANFSMLNPKNFSLVVKSTRDAVRGHGPILDLALQNGVIQGTYRVELMQAAGEALQQFTGLGKRVKNFGKVFAGGQRVAEDLAKKGELLWERSKYGKGADWVSANYRTFDDLMVDLYSANDGIFKAAHYYSLKEMQKRFAQGSKRHPAGYIDHKARSVLGHDARAILTDDEAVRNRAIRPWIDYMDERRSPALLAINRSFWGVPFAKFATAAPKTLAVAATTSPVKWQILNQIDKYMQTLHTYALGMTPNEMVKLVGQTKLAYEGPMTTVLGFDDEGDVIKSDLGRMGIIGGMMRPGDIYSQFLLSAPGLQTAVAMAPLIVGDEGAQRWNPFTKHYIREPGESKIEAAARYLGKTIPPTTLVHANKIAGEIPPKDPEQRKAWEAKARRKGRKPFLGGRISSALGFSMHKAYRTQRSVSAAGNIKFGLQDLDKRLGRLKTTGATKMTPDEVTNAALYEWMVTLDAMEEDVTTILQAGDAAPWHVWNKKRREVQARIDARK